MPYLYFSVISGFPHKTEGPFRNFLLVLPPSEKNLDTRVQLCLWGAGGGAGPGVNWKTPQKRISVPNARLLFTIISRARGTICLHLSIKGIRTGYLFCQKC